MPEGAYDDTAFSDLHYGQNYGDVAELFDDALPMAYSKAYHQDSQRVKTVAEGTLKRGMKTVVGLHAYEEGTGISLQKDIHALERVPIQGICLFREGAMALAYADGKRLQIYNAMDEMITKVLINSQEEAILLNETIASGDEKKFVLSCIPKTVQVFTLQTGMRRRHIDQGKEQPSPSHDPNFAFPQQTGMRRWHIDQGMEKSSLYHDPACATIQTGLFRNKRMQRLFNEWLKCLLKA